jgi:hypothetical protein
MADLFYAVVQAIALGYGSGLGLVVFAIIFKQGGR